MVEMTFRARRRMLWALNLAFAGGIGLSLALGFLLPMAVDAKSAAIGKAGTAGKDTQPVQQVEKVGPLSKYAVAYARELELRKPLFDAPV